jgi:hypothetical protein
MRAVPSAKVIIGGAAATAALGVRVARGLHGRWRALPPADRERIAGQADDVKEKALRLRGSAAPERAGAEAELRAANETLAAALIESAESDPELGDDQVRELRQDLRRELDRLAGADIKASRSRRSASSPAE